MMVDGEAAAALGELRARAGTRPRRGSRRRPAPTAAAADLWPEATRPRRARRADRHRPHDAAVSRRARGARGAVHVLERHRLGAPVHLHREPVPDVGAPSAPRWRAGWPSPTARGGGRAARARSTAGWSRARWASCARACCGTCSAADRHGRLRLFFPAIPGLDQELHERPREGHDRRRSLRARRLREPHQPIDGRSTPSATSCWTRELDPRLGPAVAALRNRLLAEHLDCDPQAVADALAARGSLIAAVEALRGRARSLAPVPPAPAPTRPTPRPRARRSRRWTSLSSTASPAIPSSRRPISCWRCWFPRACARPFADRWSAGDWCRGGGRAGRRLAADAAAHAAQTSSGWPPSAARSPIIRRRRWPCWRPTWSGRWCSSRSRCCSARPRCCFPAPAAIVYCMVGRAVGGGHDLRHRAAGRTLSPRAGCSAPPAAASGGSCAAAASLAVIAARMLPGRQLLAHQHHRRRAGRPVSRLPDRQRDRPSARGAGADRVRRSDRRHRPQAARREPDRARRGGRRARRRRCGGSNAASRRTEMTADDRTLRVASYNIHECVGSDGRRDPARIAAVLREIDADIIGLQEVDARPGATSESMQMQYLAAALGHHAVAGPTLAAPTGEYGNALLTRRRVLDVRHVDLTVYRREPRGALDVDLDIDGAAVRVLVTHLGLLPGERRMQVRRLLDLLGEQPLRRRRPVRRHQRMVRGRASPALAARAPGTDRRRPHLSRRISGIRARSHLGSPAHRAGNADRAREPGGRGWRRITCRCWRTSGSAASDRMLMSNVRLRISAARWCWASPCCWGPRCAPRTLTRGSAATRRCTSRPAPRWRRWLTPAPRW